MAVPPLHGTHHRALRCAAGWSGYAGLRRYRCRGGTTVTTGRNSPEAFPRECLRLDARSSLLAWESWCGGQPSRQWKVVGDPH